LAGVLAALDYAAHQNVPHVVTVAADTPFFPLDLVARLSASAPLAMAVTSEGDRIARHPTFGVWPVALREDLRSALQNGVRKVVQWTAPHGCQQVMFENAPYDPFFNVNRPDDMRIAERMYQRYLT